MRANFLLVLLATLACAVYSADVEMQSMADLEEAMRLAAETTDEAHAESWQTLNEGVADLANEHLSAHDDVAVHANLMAEDLAAALEVDPSLLSVEEQVDADSAAEVDAEVDAHHQAAAEHGITSQFQFVRAAGALGRSVDVAAAEQQAMEDQLASHVSFLEQSLQEATGESADADADADAEVDADVDMDDELDADTEESANAEQEVAMTAEQREEAEAAHSPVVKYYRSRLSRMGVPMTRSMNRFIWRRIRSFPEHTVTIYGSQINPHPIAVRILADRLNGVRNRLRAVRRARAQNIRRLAYRTQKFLNRLARASISERSLVAQALATRPQDYKRRYAYRDLIRKYKQQSIQADAEEKARAEEKAKEEKAKEEDAEKEGDAESEDAEEGAEEQEQEQDDEQDDDEAEDNTAEVVKQTVMDSTKSKTAATKVAAEVTKKTSASDDKVIKQTIKDSTQSTKAASKSTKAASSKSSKKANEKAMEKAAMDAIKPKASKKTAKVTKKASKVSKVSAANEKVMEKAAMDAIKPKTAKKTAKKAAAKTAKGKVAKKSVKGKAAHERACDNAIKFADNCEDKNIKSAKCKRAARLADKCDEEEDRDDRDDEDDEEEDEDEDKVVKQTVKAAAKDAAKSTKSGSNKAATKATKKAKVSVKKAVSNATKKVSTPVKKAVAANATTFVESSSAESEAAEDQDEEDIDAAFDNELDSSLADEEEVADISDIEGMATNALSEDNVPTQSEVRAKLAKLTSTPAFRSDGVSSEAATGSAAETPSVFQHEPTNRMQQLLQLM